MHVPMYIEICQKYLKLGNNYDIGYRIRVRVRYRDRVRGYQDFSLPGIFAPRAKVPSGNFRSEERKYWGAKSP